MLHSNHRRLLALALTAACASHHAGAAPVSVTILGTLQSEVGCPADVDPTCTSTFLTYDATDDVWQGSFTLPAGSYDYKAALNGGFDMVYGLHAQSPGANITTVVPTSGAVKFYYDDKSHWVTDSLSARIVVAPGSFQSELGCVADFDPSCLRSWLQDLDGDGIYTLTTTDLPIGTYDTKATINESFDEVYGAGGVAGGDNITFNVAKANEEVRFKFVSETNVLTVEVGAAQPPGTVPEPGSLALVGLGLAGLVWRRMGRVVRR